MGKIGLLLLAALLLVPTFGALSGCEVPENPVVGGDDDDDDD